MNTREKIVAMVKSNKFSSLNSLLQIDDQNYSCIRYLIKILTGFDVEISIIPDTKSLKFTDTSGEISLEIEKTISGEFRGSGKLANMLEALIASIRVHEVDSYEWVHFPPEMRKSFIAERAQATGTTPQELKRLTNIWLA